MQTAFCESVGISERREDERGAVYSLPRRRCHLRRTGPHRSWTRLPRRQRLRTRLRSPRMH